MVLPAELVVVITPAPPAPVAVLLPCEVALLEPEPPVAVPLAVGMVVV